MKNILIIFVKNPVLGKVKSRLAKTIGEEKALSVYKKLLIMTREAVKDMKADKRVCYSDRIDREDIWDNAIFQKTLQEGEGLGQKMDHAINDAAKGSYQKICLIGSDIPQLTDEIIAKAFHLLDDHDVVLGPSIDGGYYLVGMKSPMISIFENISWGTHVVLEETIDKIRKANLNYALLPTLNDIDEIEDIQAGNIDFLLS